MTPTFFPQANCTFGPPPDLDKSQVRTIPGYQDVICGGSIDGIQRTMVAWQPSEEDLERLNNGGVIYISMIGSLAPHFLTTSFEEGKRVA